MKRLILSILACLLLAAPALAFDGACQDGEPWQLARMSPAILGASGGACVPEDKDYRTTQANTAVLSFYDTTTDRYCSVSTFTSSSEYIAKSVSVSLKKTNTPTGLMRGLLCGVSDGDPVSCVSSDNTIDVSTLTTSYVWYTFNFSSGYSISSGTQYFVGISGDTIHATNIVEWEAYSSDSDDKVMTNNASGCAGSWIHWDSTAQAYFKVNICTQ